MEIAQLSDLLKECGIVGAGGAGFPTYAKLDKRAKTIILNCAECEPLLRLHRQLLGHHAYEVLSAFYEIGKAVGAEKMIIGMKRAYSNTIEAVQEYLGLYKGMELKLLDEVYPAGDEVVLIYETTGKVVPPGGLPIEIGVAVFNVETVYNIHRALNYNEPVTDKLVTLAGEVEHPMTIRIPLGMTVREALTFAGKELVSDPAYVMGGPMMGNLVSGNDLITKTSNAIIVLPKDHPVVLKKQKNILEIFLKI